MRQLLCEYDKTLRVSLLRLRYSLSMWYRNLLRMAFYAALFFLFSYAESQIGLYGFSLALLMALFYARENILFLLPVYALVTLVFDFSVQGAVFAATPVVIVLVAALLQYKLKLRGKPALVNLYTLLGCIPFIAFARAEVTSAVYAVLSVATAILSLNAFLSVLYAARVRGLRYKLSPEEVAATLGVVFILFLNLGELNVYAFPFAPLFGVALVSFAALLSPFAALAAGGVLGLGIAFAEFRLGIAGLWFCMALSAAFVKKLKPVIPVAMLAVDAVLNLLFGIYPNYSYFYVISAGLGGILYLATYRLLEPKIDAFCEIQRGGMAERSAINRTRKGVADRLRSAEDSFFEIEESLKSDGAATSGITVAEVTAKVYNAACASCVDLPKCTKALGETTHFALAPLAVAALEKGKASLLDMPSFLTSRCGSVNLLLKQVNAVAEDGFMRLERLKQEREAQAMLARLVSGVRGVLASLREEVGSPLSYETKTERALIDQLNYQGITATEAVVYRGKECEINVIVKEGDHIKQELKETVSRIMGTQMIQTKQEPTVCGMVGVTFVKRPRYGVAFGKGITSKEEGQPSGDTIEAIRLGASKVMFILSDGMGTGREAHDASRLIVNVIAGFYKAEFTHEAVVSAASALFSMSRGERFNALDIAVLDLISGEAYFIKMGGRETYVAQSGELEILPAGALPLGILDEAQPSFFKRKLSDGDFFVLLSDGVADALKEEEIAKILLSSKTVNPDIIAKSVLADAIRMGGSQDDASCIAVRIFQS